MESLEHASNVELLATLAGKPAAQALVQHYGGLTALARASFDELRLVKGIGRSKAAALIIVHNRPSGDPTPSEQDI